MISRENWRVIIASSAGKSLKRIPSNYLNQIEKAIDQMIIDPLTGDVIKLSGKENIWRRRVGNYRIVFEILFEKRSVYIHEIMRRTSKSY